ncbi:hypothetical protein D3C78_1199650 [compost metagenome]
MLFPIVGEEGVDIGAVDTFGGDVAVPVGAEQCGQSLGVGLLRAERGYEGFGGGFRRGEPLLRLEALGRQAQQNDGQGAKCSMHGESPIRVDEHRPGMARGPGVAPGGRRALPVAGWPRRG